MVRIRRGRERRNLFGLQPETYTHRQQRDSRKIEQQFFTFCVQETTLHLVILRGNLEYGEIGSLSIRYNERTTHERKWKNKPPMFSSKWGKGGIQNSTSKLKELRVTGVGRLGFDSCITGADEKWNTEVKKLSIRSGGREDWNSGQSDIPQYTHENFQHYTAFWIFAARNTWWLVLSRRKTVQQLNILEK